MATVRLALVSILVLMTASGCLFGEDLSSGEHFFDFEYELRRAQSSEQEARAVSAWNADFVQQTHNSYTVTFQDFNRHKIAVADLDRWLKEHPDEALWVDLDFRVTQGPSGGRFEYKLINRNNWKLFLVGE